MRSFIIAIILFSLAVGIVCANSFYVGSVMNELTSLSSALEETPSRAERTEILTQIDKIWKKSRPLLSLSIEANELIQMNEYITALSACNSSDRNSEFLRNCILTKELAEEFMSHVRFSIDSIF